MPRDELVPPPVPVSDPTSLYRIRDGVYAPDLLTVAVCDLDLFTWLVHREAHGDPPPDVATIAAAHALDARPVDVMVTYLTALGLLRRTGDTLTPAPQARDHLAAGSPFDLRPYYASLRERPGCTELLGVLRTGRPAAWASATPIDHAGPTVGSHGQDWAGRLGDPAFAGTITAAMDARGRYLAPALARALTDLGARRVLDVVGSSGIYAAALADGLGLTGTVFERPPVDTVARTLLADRGHADRIGVHTGDMLTDPLPGGHDLHLYSHVLHDWDAATVRHLLTASYAALEPGGHLVDHDVHVDADKTGPLPAAEYSVLLMHATPGKCWSTGELTAMLTAAGFVDVTVRPTVADRSAVIARKPGEHDSGPDEPVPAPR